MYNDYALIKKSTLTETADAIRLKKGTTSLIDPVDFSSEIKSIAGSTITTLESHTEIESIITDGLSYINTNICPNPNYSIEMKFKVSQIVENNWYFLFGCKYGDKSGIAARFDTGESGTLAIKRSQTYLSTREWGIVNFTKKDFSNYRVLKLAKNEAYIDDALVYTFTATTTANEQHYAYPLYLFTVNDSNTTHPLNFGYFDVKYVKLWDEKDNLILDLIPVVKNDGTVCMYNKVNGAYYYNAGTGKFSAKVNFVIDNTLYLRSEGGVKIPAGCTTSGNYIDCEGQEWLYNTVDLNAKIKTQRVSYIVLDGSEEWGYNTRTLDGNTYNDFYVASPHDMRNYIINAGTYDIAPIYIEGFKVWSQYNINNNYYNTVRNGFFNAASYYYTGGTDYINMIDKDCMTLSASEWKTHLATNPKTLYYALNTSITSTLTDEEIVALMGVMNTVNPEEPSTSVDLIDALIDIDMLNNGINIGTGGSIYDAVNHNGTFIDGKFVLDNPGCLTVPTEFMAESSTKPWTVAFTIDNYTVSNEQYSRIARGSTDVPSIYWSNQNPPNGFEHKLVSQSSLNNTLIDRSCGTTWYDESFYTVSDNGRIQFPDFSGTKTTFVFRNDGVNTELWINGEKKCVADTSKYTSDYWAHTFSIGNSEYDSGNDYSIWNASHLECSMLKLWDRAITDDEIGVLCN